MEERWSFRETRLNIKSDRECSARSAIRAALEARRKIERYIIRKPEFRSSLEPLDWDEENYSGVINLMLRASKIAGVGPFAAVAGSISQVSAKAGIRRGAEEMMVDNGGDVSIIGNREYQVGIYAGFSPASGRFAFSIDPEGLPIGVCTSSGSVGHSLSFGDADSVTVVADEASVADAAATGIANEVNGEDVESSIKKGLDKADDVHEIRGCLIIREAEVGVVGKLPEILTLSGEARAFPRELKSGFSSPIK